MQLSRSSKLKRKAVESLRRSLKGWNCWILPRCFKSGSSTRLLNERKSEDPKNTALNNWVWSWRGWSNGDLLRRFTHSETERRKKTSKPII